MIRPTLQSLSCTAPTSAFGNSLRNPHLPLHVHASEIIPTPIPTVACPPEKFYAIVLRTPLSARIESHFYYRAKDMANQKSQARHEVILCMKVLYHY